MERRDPPVLIAEVSCNHKGDIAIAREFIDVASTFCKVTHLKFQIKTQRGAYSGRTVQCPTSRTRELLWQHLR